ncbi:polysaccharide deacetylase family protein [Streptacidiphilus sp. PB12-B1b]|uniref:polysaccharide deacetylase family protein n=1 Tax=Streptacidiphilus sp. PB12-B1b TaxID=2705012 RepID=UPI0015FA1733|nr:polysaccharide deacetylase family protein [Streptacidiphilus sp. PB12-B1b]QMU79185.1 polysaccharide deacetylase family protein [Streptacidiphilus sp. PB12-B1b]
MSPLERRDLLRLAALGAAGSLTAACADGSARSAAVQPSPVRSTPSAGTAAAAGSAAPGPAGLPRLAAGLPFEIGTGPRDRPAVALTFHGQGDPAIAGSLLAEAERAGARVTVLAVGSWLDEQPQMARRILDGGHELGNHTQNHGAISTMSADDAYQEIARCAQRLTRLTGTPGRWFRPSQAQDCTATVAAQARRAGYAHCLSYDLDSLDYTDPGPDAVTRTVLDAVRPGSVVSLHFGHTGTVAALPAILDGLHQRGLRAVTTSELLS